MTVTEPAARSMSRPPRPHSSATRSPLPYSSSKMASSRRRMASSSASTLAGGSSTSQTAQPGQDGGGGGGDDDGTDPPYPPDERRPDMPAGHRRHVGCPIRSHQPAWPRTQPARWRRDSAAAV